MNDQIHQLAVELYQQRSLLVMGRGFNYATCLEGALVFISLFIFNQSFIKRRLQTDQRPWYASAYLQGCPFP